MVVVSVLALSCIVWTVESASYVNYLRAHEDRFELLDTLITGLIYFQNLDPLSGPLSELLVLQFVSNETRPVIGLGLCYGVAFGVVAGLYGVIWSALKALSQSSDGFFPLATLRRLLIVLVVLSGLIVAIGALHLPMLVSTFEVQVSLLMIGAAIAGLAVCAVIYGTASYAAYYLVACGFSLRRRLGR